MTTTVVVRTPVRHPPTNTTTHEGARGQKAASVAALYVALALLAAIPYFLLVVDYPGASIGVVLLTTKATPAKAPGR